MTQTAVAPSYSIKKPEPAIKSKIYQEQVIITPAIAKQFLMSNNINRPLREFEIKGLENIIRSGKWIPQTDVIAFDNTGMLINGQHRLHAIIRANKAVECTIGYNYSPSAFAVIDNGLSRSAGDVVFSRGISNQYAMAAIAKMIFLYKNGQLSYVNESAKKINGPDNIEIADFVEKNIVKIRKAHDIAKKSSKTLKEISNRHLAFLYHAFSEKSSMDADSFMELYSTGVGLTERHPIHTLRNQLIANKRATNKYSDRIKMAWAIIAWNMYRDGKKGKSIRFNPEKDEFPKIM